MSDRCWKLSPSDLAGLWDACPRCFYLKVVLGFPRPQPLAPKVFARIDEQLRACCEGRRTETLVPEMPAGVFEIGEHWVESIPLDIHLPDAVHRCLIRGSFGSTIRLDEGGYAVVDFATSDRGGEHITRYARQLLAYAYALEHPAPGALALSPIRRLGLLVFDPERFAHEGSGQATLTGELGWVEIPRDDGRLFGLLAEILSVLERPEPPGGAPLCDWCVYRDASRRTGL